MSHSDLVRFSRDGDQFHYVWAARRCLRLLSPTSGLVAVSIEGASRSESPSVGTLEAGEELIDIAEYYGSEEVVKATRIRYYQLKHSTQHSADEWPPSGLKKTISGFAKRYLDLAGRPALGSLSDKLEFYFVSNRPINANFFQTVTSVANELPAPFPGDLKKLEEFTSLTGSRLAAFCKLLHLEGEHAGLRAQRESFRQDIGSYLAGADIDAPAHLRSLVTEKALSENASNPTIRKVDVLRALGTDEDRLLPAPCLIRDEDTIPREQEVELFAMIRGASAGPVIVHADGGVGKSILATRIKLGMPDGSQCVVFDCFGDGGYQRVSSYRHRHKEALVQIANVTSPHELYHSLC